MVLSNADPQRTYLGMVGEKHLPDDLVEGVETMRVEGSVVKVLLALGELSDVEALPGNSPRPQHTGGIVINPFDGLAAGSVGRVRAGRTFQAAVHGRLHTERHGRR